jgi:hypothetical protein
MESGRALGGIEDTQAAAGPSTYINKMATLIEGSRNSVDSLLNPRDFAGDGGRNLGICRNHRSKYLASWWRNGRMPFCYFTFRQ